MSNHKDGTIYIGVTNNLVRRVWEHKNKLLEGFTKKYNLTNLVYYECIEGEKQAIEREKYLKKCFRHQKKSLIEHLNPQWNDLFDSIL